jgi:hypothetical protein
MESRSRVGTEAVARVAVEPEQIHFFDLETGSALFNSATPAPVLAPT